MASISFSLVFNFRINYIRILEYLRKKEYTVKHDAEEYVLK